MARTTKHIAMTLLLLLSFQSNSCGQFTGKRIIAQKDSYELKAQHILAYAHIEEPNRTHPFSKEELSNYEKIVLELFNSDPELTLLLFEERVKSDPKSTADASEQASFHTAKGITAKDLSEVLPQGFLEFRKVLGITDLSYFNNEQANSLRGLLRNTQISHEAVESYGNSSVGGGGNYTENIAFCQNGTFRFQSLSASSIGNGDFGGYSKATTDFEGVWDVFVEQGRVFIGLYSEDQEVLQYNPKGFIPILVQSYGANMLTVASEGTSKYYRKTRYACPLR